MSNNIVIPADGTWHVKVNGECTKVIAWFIDEDEGMVPRPIVLEFGVMPVEEPGSQMMHNHSRGSCPVAEDRQNAARIATQRWVTEYRS